MEKALPTKPETVRALREIILTVVETNLKENRNIETLNQFIESVFSPFHSRVYISNSIQVRLIDNQIKIQLSLNVKNAISLFRELKELQKRIYEDIFKITGFTVDDIRIKVKRISTE